MKTTMLLTAVATTFSLASVANANLVISEVMANPAGLLDRWGEWFEVYNAGSEELDLEGIRFESNGTQSFTVAGNHILAPDEYYVFGASDNMDVNGGVPVDYRYDYYHFSLNDKADLISASYHGDVLDVARYAAASYGRTLFLPNVILDNGMERNWYHSNIETYEANTGINHGTPGYANEDLLLIDFQNETVEAPLGSTLSFSVEIHNPTDRVVDFDAWIRVSGASVDAIVKTALGHSLSPMQTIEQTVQLSVPSRIETGIYTIAVESGSFDEEMAPWAQSYDVMITQ